MTLRSKNIGYYSCLVLAQVMVGINIAGSKLLLLYLPAIFLLCFRFMASTILLMMIQACIPGSKSHNKQTLIQLSKKDWGYIIAQGLSAGILFNLLLLIGLHFTSAAMAGIVTSALPAMVLILSVVFLREKLTLFSSLCILFSIIGLLVVNAKNFEAADLKHLWGAGIILLSLIPEAAYYLLAKVHHSRLPIFKLSAVINGINIPIALFLVWLTKAYPIIHFDLQTSIVLILVGISSGLFYLFWGIGAKHVTGSTAGLFTALMPISTLFIAWLFLGESISLSQSIGMALVIMAIIVNAIRQKKKNINPP